MHFRYFNVFLMFMAAPFQETFCLVSGVSLTSERSYVG